MTAAWMLFALLLSVLLCGWAELAERVALSRRTPTRWAWVLAMTGSLLLPLAPLFARSGWLTGGRQGSGEVGDPIVIAADPGTVAAAGWLTRMEPWILGAWAVAAALAISALIGAALMLRRRRRSWRPATVLGHPVLVSTDSGPAATGILRREIVVPGWVLEASEADQRLLLAHEVEHHRARDPLLLLAARFACAALPWNLALGWQLRRLRSAVELDCDARVLRGSLGPARSYCLLLLEATRRATRPGDALALAAPGMLERRLRILTGEIPRRPPLAVPAIACAAVMIPLLSVALPAPPPPTLASLRAAVGTASAPAQPPALAHVASGRAELLNRHEAPRILRGRYPALLRDAGVGGTAVVEAFIGEDGRVREVRIGEGSGHAALDGAALEVMRELRFTPARAGGRPIATWIQHPVTFLPDGEPAAGPPVRVALWTSPG